MDKGALKDFTYGALTELLHNRKYYYHSAVGPEYSHFTDEGKEALTEFMNIMAHKMLQAEEAEIRRIAKEQTMNSLKGDNK
jgi:hypothetical protein